MQEKQPDVYKGFAAFGEALQKEKADRARKIQEQFETVLQNRLQDVPAGNYGSELNGISSISITHPLKEYAADILNATLYYPVKDGRENAFTLRLNNRGEISGDWIPREVEMTAEDAKAEILRIVDSVGLTESKWLGANADIVPDQDPGEEKELWGMEKEPRKPVIDPERLPFIHNQEGFIIGFYDRKNGFNGYRVALFRYFIILECEIKGNATYIIDVSEPIELDEETKEKIAKRTITQEEIDRIADRCWGPIGRVARTRKQLIEQFGAQRIEHRGKQETWMHKYQEVINEHKSRTIPLAEEEREEEVEVEI